MIGRLKGILENVEFTRVLVDVHGVGYDVSIPMSTYDKLPASGKEVSLWIHTDVREDAIVLFGFGSENERELFRALISVSGVGPKSALNILSCMPASRFANAVVTGDIKTLQGINGIGKKSAERLVVELRDKMRKFTLNESGTTSGEVFSTAALDAMAALEQLGFKKESVQKQVTHLIETLPKEQQNTENIIRTALSSLNK